MNRYYYTGYEQDDEPSDYESDKSESDNEIENDFAQYEKSEQKQISNLFEANMNNNLNKLFENIVQQKEEIKQIENEEESDTDSEAEEATGERVKIKRKHYTNDELFYDPKADDLDQEWIDKKRIPMKSNKTSKSQELVESNRSNTDATLNCPCCMSLLCMDCQRHEKYPSQYRAMFVFNCKIDTNELLKYPQKKKTNKNKDNDEYQTVYCNICNTKIAVYEPKDEIYHFFNVLASHS